MDRIVALLLLVTVIGGIGKAQTGRDERASLTGRVTDNSGNPVAAKIVVYQIVVNDGFANVYGKCSTSTNIEGRYECPRLPSGQFLVEALPRVKSSHLSSSLPRFVFYPGTSDLALANMVHLRNAEAGWADIRISTARVGSISGVLADRAPGAIFTLKAAMGGLMVDSGIAPYYNQDNGQFSIQDIPPGHYIVMADWFMGGAEKRAAYPIEVSGTPITDMTISYTTNVEMTGQISNLLPDLHISQIGLQRVDGSMRDVNTPVKDGSFHFHPVPPGEYVLTVSRNKTAYVDVASLDGRGESGNHISVPEQATASILVTLKAPALAIHGSVNSWEMNAAIAEVIAQAEDTGEIYATTTDKQRDFSLMGLRPGTYRLFAWPGVDSVEYRNPQVLKFYKDQGTEVSVEESGLGSTITLVPIESKK